MTHAVLNVFRRVVIILFTSAYFGVHLGGLNLMGVAMAVCGVLLFGFSKERDKALRLAAVTVAPCSPPREGPSATATAAELDRSGGYDS